MEIDRTLVQQAIRWAGLTFIYTIYAIVLGLLVYTDKMPWYGLVFGLLVPVVLLAGSRVPPVVAQRVLGATAVLLGRAEARAQIEDRSHEHLPQLTNRGPDPPK